MGITTFILLVVIFLILTTGVAATTTLLKNSGKDMMRVLQLVESDVNHTLQQHQIHHYKVHS
jgi:hypothetical protein